MVHLNRNTKSHSSPNILTLDIALGERLLFLQLMSQNQKWCGQARTNENTKPSGQTVDIFDLERQILCKLTTKTHTRIIHIM